MKCPLSCIGDYGRDNILENEAFDCLKEECAWWGKYKSKDTPLKGVCAITALALVISDIYNHMPHEKQFRK